MPNQSMLGLFDEVWETGVLVIGAGGAGCSAAIEASKQGVNVLLVSKGFTGCGATKISGGGLCAAFGHVEPSDSTDIHFEDTLKGGEEIGDGRLARILSNDVIPAVFELERYGAAFIRKRDKPNEYYSRLKVGGHTYPRVVTSPGEGRELSHCLREEITRRNIDTVEEVMVTSLLTSKGKVGGAIGLEKNTGDFCLFRAKSTVLASGGLGNLYPFTSNMSEATGDGFAMAYRAGAELMDMEMVQFLPIAVCYPESLRGKDMADAGFFGPYGRLVNAKGERFMPRYDPELKELSTRAKVSRAIFIEVKEGRGTAHGGIWVDGRETKRKMPDWWEMIRQAFPHTIELIEEAYGRAAAEWEEPFEAYPTQHYMMGGVRMGLWGETNVPGLYVVGEVAGGVHGANRLGGNSIADLQVFGVRAGQQAAEEALKNSLPPVDPKQVERERRRIFNILKPSRGKVNVFSLEAELKDLMWNHVGIARTRKGLEHALKSLRKLKGSLRSVRVRSTSTKCNVEWLKALELYNMMDLAELIARSALVRTESRGAHYREDYPERNDAKWMKNITVRLKRGQPMLNVVNVAR